MKIAKDDIRKIEDFILYNKSEDYTIFTTCGVTAIVFHKPENPYENHDRNIPAINSWCSHGRCVHDVYCIVPGKRIAFMFSIYSNGRRDAFIYAKQYVADNGFVKAVYHDERNLVPSPDGYRNYMDDIEEYIANDRLHSSTPWEIYHREWTTPFDY